MFPARSFKTLVVDASAVRNATADTTVGVDFEDIQRQLAGMHLTVLINNAGGGLSNPTYAPLQSISEERVTSNISLNALFPMHLIRVLLPTLIANSPSLIMNITSFADQGFPFLTPYASSKALLVTLTRAPGPELTMSGHDVEVLGVKVGKTTGAFGYEMAPTLFLPHARSLAKAALDKIGCGRRIAVAYWPHALQGLPFDLVSQGLMDKLATKAILREKAAEEKARKRA